jgi:hypothetical protein
MLWTYHAAKAFDGDFSLLELVDHLHASYLQVDSLSELGLVSGQVLPHQDVVDLCLLKLKHLVLVHLVELAKNAVFLVDLALNYKAVVVQLRRIPLDLKPVMNGKSLALICEQLFEVLNICRLVKHFMQVIKFIRDLLKAPIVIDSCELVVALILLRRVLEVNIKWLKLHFLRLEVLYCVLDSKPKGLFKK